MNFCDLGRAPLGGLDRLLQSTSATTGNRFGHRKDLGGRGCRSKQLEVDVRQIRARRNNSADVHSDPNYEGGKSHVNDRGDHAGFRIALLEGRIETAEGRCRGRGSSRTRPRMHKP